MYDWRLAFRDLEVRDGYFSGLKNRIEILVQRNGGQRAVVPCHSMGGLVWFYFSQWVTARDETWIDSHVEAVMNIGVPFLGKCFFEK